MAQQNMQNKDGNTDLIDKLVSLWKTQNTGFISPSPVDQIQSTFLTVGSRASSDVIALYSKIGGMEIMEDGALWRLWPLSEIIERNTEPSSYGIMFSDHCLDAWVYRLQYETANRSSVFIDYCGYEPQKKIYDGLDDFLAAYEKEPKSILR